MMFKKVMSVFLVVVLVFSLSSPAYAVTPGDDMIGQIDLTLEEIAKANAEAKTIFEKLTPSQQAVFLASIEALAYNGDTRLIEFHKAYVDPTYEFNPSNSVSQPMATAADIGAQLQALNLPSAVYYGLMALAAALGVPVGNVIDLVISLGLVAIFAIYWDEISGVWQDIIDIFVDAFGSVVNSAFTYIEQQVFISKFNQSAEDAVNSVDDNKKNHILNNKLHDHGWNRLFNGKDPDWDDLEPILIMVLQEGVETVYNLSQRVYERTMNYNGYDVVVRFIKDIEGLIQGISTAYVK